MDETTVTSKESATTNEESALPNTESAPTKVKRPTPAEQDQMIANDITEAEAFLGVIAADPELAALLGKRGIDAAERAVAAGLLASAKDTYAARQSKLGAETSAYATLTRLAEPVATEFSDFRVLLRRRITDTGVRQALGLSSRVPTDRQKRITLMRTVYLEAKKPEHSAVMTKLGYDTAELDRLLGTVQALENAIEGARGATGEALKATEERNTAVKALRKWIGDTRATARRVLSQRLDLLAKLKL